MPACLAKIKSGAQHLIRTQDSNDHDAKICPGREKLQETLPLMIWGTFSNENHYWYYSLSTLCESNLEQIM